MPDRHGAMTWARRLKRVFKMDVETCAHCGGTVKVIACIEDPTVIKQILDHIAKRKLSNDVVASQSTRGPPSDHTLDWG